MSDNIDWGWVLIDNIDWGWVLIDNIDWGWRPIAENLADIGA